MAEDEQLSDVVKAQKLRADAQAARTADAAERLDSVEETLARVEQSLRERRIDPVAAAPASPQPQLAPVDGPGTWEELVAANQSWLREAGLADLALEDVLSAAELDLLESFDPLGRERWSVPDFVTVGGCAVIGVLATAFDAQIDAAIKTGLGGLRQTGLVQSWEAAGKQLPIDYTGPGFGGPGHRVRSAGHDIGRPFEALRQIMDGEFRGIEWDDGQMFTVVSDTSPRGRPYVPHTLGEALLLWLQHLGADIVTTTSLPLPWWSKLYECDSRDLRKLAHDIYNPGGGYGINVRSMMISKTLPVISTEVIVNVKVHLDAHDRRGTFRLSADEALKRNEMLLAGHAATGLASLGKTAITAATLPPGTEWLALRHVNAPALARVGWEGVKVVREHHRRRVDREIPTWADLIRLQAPPWELDELALIRGAASA